MSDYKPGMVATVRYFGADCRAMRTGTPSNMGWECVRGDGSKTWASDSSECVTDIRPLVVLDLCAYDEIHGPEALRYLADDADKGKGGNVFARIARDIADQIEAQVQPPRIPEPGLWGVVEAHIIGDISGRPQSMYQWVHLPDGRWSALASGQPTRRWDDLIDPTLIREGLS